MSILLGEVVKGNQAGSAVSAPVSIEDVINSFQSDGTTNVITWENIAIFVGAQAAADLANVKLATLESGVVPGAQLPLSGFEFQGDYNPATNTPALANADTGKVNWVYRITGSANPTARDFGAGSINCSDDEYVAYSGASGSGAWINIGQGATKQLAEGGTGATTAAGARTNLALYSKGEINDRQLSKAPANGLRFALAADKVAGTGLSALIGLSDFDVAWTMAWHTDSGANQYIVELGTSSADRVVINSSQQLVLRLGGAEYSVGPTLVVHEEFKKYWLTCDRDGNATLYINGVVQSTTPDISAESAYSLADSGWTVNSGTLSDITLTDVEVYNRNHTGAEIADRSAQNNILPSDQWAGANGGVYTSDFSAGVDGWTAIAGTAAGNVDSIGGQDDNLRLTVDTANAVHMLEKLSQFTANNRYCVSVDYYIPSANSHLDGITFSDGTGPEETIQSTTDAWTTWTFDFLAQGTKARFRAADGATTTFQDAGGDDVIYIRNVKITKIGAVFSLQGRNLEAATWLDESTNELDGTITGATRLFDPAPQSSGTWSPGIAFGGGTTGLTYSSQEGYLRKLSEKVYLFWGSLVLSAKGSSTGAATLTGFPETSKNSTRDGQTFQVKAASMNGLSSPVFGECDNNSTVATLFDTAAGGSSTLDDTNFSASSEISFSAIIEIE